MYFEGMYATKVTMSFVKTINDLCVAIVGCLILKKFIIIFNKKGEAYKTNYNGDFKNSCSS